ncbi:MAG: efflux RND transporter permease subunit [candidate division Zixibacteria bacterium]|nr:efflux RND transporter permease subunit [candidate division Zixibacteria bacterium]
MSITQLAIEKNRITTVALIVIIFAGFLAYQNIARQEDPGFIIRVAFIQTILPGASPDRVENLVTDKLEKTIQEIPELDFISSESKTGASIIYVNIKATYKEMQPIWDRLRRKIDRAKTELPDGVIGPFVNDEFGDVFGIQLTITGEGYSYAELKDVADQVRDELLRIPDAAKVDIYGAQEEHIFVEYNNARLANIGLSPGQLQSILTSQNILFPGGDINTRDERIILEPSGSFETLDELKQTVINIPGRKDVIFLGDLADIYRGYIDPPKSMMRSSGVPCLGLGISLRKGGNIIELGEQVRQVMAYLQQRYPIGIEFDTIVFQPDEVNTSVNNFIKSLLQAILIVMVVMFLALGFRTGLLVSSLIPTVILTSLAVMNYFGISLNTVSLAALIISLGLLVDNAIVMSESIMVSLSEGKKPIEAAVESAAELRIPLLTSSLTTAAAFLPIYLAESDTGEYTADLFRVVSISLLISWVLALTMTPLLCAKYMKIKAVVRDKSKFDSKFYRRYRQALIGILKRPVISLLGAIAIFLAAMQLGGLIPNIFFPKSDRSFLQGELVLPLGTPIAQTRAMMDEVEQFIEDSCKVNDERLEGITNWAAFIGTGAPRFYLSANPQPQRDELAFLIANATSRQAVDEVIPRIEEFATNRFPDVSTVIDALDYGPPVMAPVQIRISGKDPELLFSIVDDVKAKLAEIPGTKNIDTDWGTWTKKLLVDIDQPRARRAGVTNMDIAISLQSILSGIETTQFREENKIIPITLRAEASDRHDLDKLETLDVYSQSTGKTVPLKQVANIEVKWQPSKILRRDRLKTVTIKSYVLPGTVAIDVVNKIDPYLREISKNWPVGYFYEHGGEIENTVKANNSIMAKLPIAFAFITLLLVAQFNSFRKPLIILATMPLAMIGVFIGLVITGSAMGFMTFLGVISLAGIVINNAIVLIDRINIEQEEHGVEIRRAILESAQKRLRPILLTTATTIGGMMPLWLGGGPMYESMAVTIIFGLLFATILTLGFVPLLYVLFFRIKYKGFEY